MPLAGKQKLAIVFTKTQGLSNKFHPARYPYDPNTGVLFLMQAMNMDIDDTGRLSTCRGTTVTSITTPCHSGWSDDKIALLVNGGWLNLFNTPTSLVPLKQVDPAARMSYCRYYDFVFFTNGLEHGWIADGTVFPWIVPTYAGPETHITFEEPPVGHLFSSFQGYLLYARDNVLYFSRRFSPFEFNLADDYLTWDGKVRFIGPVSDGVWIGDDQGMWFLRTMEAKNSFTIEHVTTMKATPGSGQFIDTDRLGENAKDSEGMAWLVHADEEICLATNAGVFKNLTIEILTIPGELRSTSGLVRNKYILNLGVQ